MMKWTSIYILIHGNPNFKIFFTIPRPPSSSVIFLNFVIRLQKFFQHIYWKKSMYKWTLTVWTHVVQGWPFVPSGKSYRTNFSQPREDGEFGAVHSLDQSITQRTKKKTLVQKLTEDNRQKLRVKRVRGDCQSKKAMALHWENTEKTAWTGLIWRSSQTSGGLQGQEGRWTAQEVPSGLTQLRGEATIQLWNQSSKEHPGTLEISRYPTASLQHGLFHQHLERETIAPSLYKLRAGFRTARRVQSTFIM